MKPTAPSSKRQKTTYQAVNGGFHQSGNVENHGSITYTEAPRAASEFDPGESVGEAEREEVITGGSDSSLPINFLCRGYEVQWAVFRITVKNTHNRKGRNGLPDKLVHPNAPLGTGFLISGGGCVMTNHHVIYEKGLLPNLQAEFFYQEGQTTETIDFKADGFFETSPPEDYDYTVIQLARLPERRVAPIALPWATTVAKLHGGVNIIGHPKGKEKRVALKDNKVLDVRAKALVYATDTEPGSSGGKKVDKNGYYLENFGVLIEPIVNSLHGSANEELKMELAEAGQAYWAPM